jgi:hypothetical protein
MVETAESSFAWFLHQSKETLSKYFMTQMARANNPAVKITRPPERSADPLVPRPQLRAGGETSAGRLVIN